MVFGWVLIITFLIIGLCFVLLPERIGAWWIEKGTQITNELGVFKPTGSSRYYFKLWAWLLRIMGLIFFFGSIYVTYLLLFT